MDNFDQRLRSLEQKVYGFNYDIEDQNNVKDMSNDMSQKLAAISNRLSSLLKSREKLGQMLKTDDLKQVEKFLDPTYMETISMPMSARLAVLDVSIDRLEKMCEQLQLVDKLKSSLDSEHVRSAPDLRLQIVELAQKQSVIGRNVNEHNERVSELLNIYNLLITELSRQFVIWDLIVKQREMKQKLKRES